MGRKGDGAVPYKGVRQVRNPESTRKKIPVRLQAKIRVIKIKNTDNTCLKTRQCF